LFPIVTDLMTGQMARFGRQLGTLYAVNTVGGIVGSFLSGFVLIPLFGLPGGPSRTNFVWCFVLIASSAGNRRSSEPGPVDRQ
jgi:spermidine synthase